MKIRSKLSGAFILLLMLMLLIGGLAIKQLGGTDELTDVIQNNTIPSIVMAGKMESLLQKKRLLVMKFVAARDARELEPLIAENRQLDEGMEHIKQIAFYILRNSMCGCVFNIFRDKLNFLGSTQSTENFFNIIHNSTI
jgi:hypothetical protein